MAAEPSSIMISFVGLGLPILLLLYVLSTVLPGPLGRLGGMAFFALLGFALFALFLAGAPPDAIPPMVH